MLTAIVRPTRRSILLSSLALMCTGPAALADVAFDLRSYKGKVVVVDFWASWCVPCRRSFPWLNDIYDRYSGAADQFLRDYPPRFTVIFGEGEALAKDFDVVAMPSSYLIGRDGKILHRHLGFLVKQQDEYEAAIAEALGDKE